MGKFRGVKQKHFDCKKMVKNKRLQEILSKAGGKNRGRKKCRICVNRKEVGEFKANNNRVGTRYSGV
jgi:hypothetical protein